MTRKKQSKRGLRVCCLMGCMVLLFSQPFGISAQQTEQGGPGKVSAADSQQDVYKRQEWGRMCEKDIYSSGISGYCDDI